MKRNLKNEKIKQRPTPAEWEDFQKTALFCLLMERQDDCKILFRFFCADSLEDLKYVPNPITVFHTPYDQEDFEEICDFLRYNGVPETGTFIAGLSQCLSLLHTNVVKFSIYNENGIMQGILSGTNIE